MKPIFVLESKVDYITVTSNTQQQVNEKVDLYISKGWERYHPTSGDTMKVRLTKLGYDMIEIMTDNEKGIEMATDKLSKEGYKHTLIKRHRNDVIEGLYLRKQEPKTFDKPDQINSDFISDDTHLEQSKNIEDNSNPYCINYPKLKDKLKPILEKVKESLEAPKYLYFEDGDSAEVIAWANMQAKKGYRLLTGITPRVHFGNYMYHVTMVKHETV